MEKIEFKSQICTTREQSERLLALGLKKETADMVYHYRDSRIELMRWELRPHPPVLRSNYRFNIERLNVLKQKNSDGVVMSGEEYFDVLWGNDIPAWSLHRLMEIMYAGDMYSFSGIRMGEDNVNILYEDVITHIAKLISIGHFDEKYLEEKL